MQIHSFTVLCVYIDILLYVQNILWNFRWKQPPPPFVLLSIFCREAVNKLDLYMRRQNKYAGVENHTEDCNGRENVSSTKEGGIEWNGGKLHERKICERQTLRKQAYVTSGSLLFHLCFTSYHIYFIWAAWSNWRCSCPWQGGWK